MSNDDSKKDSGESVRIIEGKWDCTSCGAKGILGRHKECPSCSSPREEGKETNFEFGAASTDGSLQAETVSDASALTQAARGEDWFCRFCNSANPGDTPLCGKCGAEKSKAALTPDQARVRGLVPEKSATPAPAAGATRKKIPGWLKGVAAVGLGLFLWNAFRTEEISATVERAAWKHQVMRESFQAKTTGAWQDEIRLRAPKMPVQGAGEDGGAFNLRNCQRKFRRTEQFPCGEQRVCHPAQETYSCGSERKCTVKNLKNGFAQEVCRDVPKSCTRTVERCGMETRYCPREVFGAWCDYDHYEWVSSGNEEASGEGADLRWPSLATTETDRLKRTAAYEIVLRESIRGGGKARDWSLKPASEAEFLSFARARSVRVMLSGLGSLKQAQPEGTK